MSLLLPAYRLPFQGWRAFALVFLGSAAAFGVPAAILTTFGVTIGQLQIPVLPSGIAFVLLLLFGWRALPGIVGGAAATAVWFTIHGSPSVEITVTGWFLLLPLGACAQAVVSYTLSCKVAPALLHTSSSRDYWRYLLISLPAGSMVGAIFAGAAMGPASGHPLADGVSGGGYVVGARYRIFTRYDHIHLWVFQQV